MLEQWEHRGATFVEANVTYTRTDAAEVSVPVVTIYRTNGHRVYIDLAPVFAAVAEPPAV